MREKREPEQRGQAPDRGDFRSEVASDHIRVRHRGPDRVRNGCRVDRERADHGGGEVIHDA